MIGVYKMNEIVLWRKKLLSPVENSDWASEMVLNPATFIEYDVSIFDGETHRLTVNRDLVE